VEDVVAANLLACQAEGNAASGKVFNVATGRRTDLYETFQILKKLIGYSGEVKYGPERSGDVKHSLADISRAGQYLGYRPKVDFEEGLSRTIEWYRDREGKPRSLKDSTGVNV
jgi:nucleoside-diphosphate-sugar epimerase